MLPSGILVAIHARVECFDLGKQHCLAATADAGVSPGLRGDTVYSRIVDVIELSLQYLMPPENPRSWAPSSIVLLRAS